MKENKQIQQVESKIIVIRDTQVVLDRDIAELYGVETRDINKAVKNNPDKFPQDYIITLNKEEKKNWWKISTGSTHLSIQHLFQKPLQKKGFICLQLL